MKDDEKRKVAEIMRTSAIATARNVLGANESFRVSDDARVREIDGEFYIQIWLRFTNLRGGQR